jgi:peptidoglycan/LPS O-acetylase OafA/YrhL
MSPLASVTFLSVGPALLLVAVCLVLCAGVARLSPFYRAELDRTVGARYGTIDGTRGFLAFGVYLTHCASAHTYYLTRQWGWPASPFYQMCGSATIAMFFMITGFLFWQKALRTPGAMDLRKLAVSRLRRLAPLYLACVPFVLAAVWVSSGCGLRVPLLELVGSIVRWCALGMLGSPDINGVVETRLFNPALWTLKYEWLFYVLLPLLSFFATLRRFPFLVVGWVAIAVVHDDRVIVNFLTGMALAHALAIVPTSRFMASAPAAGFAVALVIGCGLLPIDNYGIGQCLMLSFPFAVIVYGNDFFGLLSSRPARLLGLVSYSIYLTHCLVLRGSLHVLDAWIPVTTWQPLGYWIATYVIGIIVVLVSLVTYRWIEHPFMKAR